MLTIRVPVPSSMLVANLLGVLGLLCITLAVGGLTGNWWWSALAGGVVLVALSIVAATHVAAEQATEPPPASRFPRTA